MSQIKALVQTYLKKEPVQSSELSSSELQPVDAGEEFDVSSYRVAKDGAHIEVVIKGQTWYIFDPPQGGHWHCSWDDEREEDDKGDVQVVPASQWRGDFSQYVTPHFRWGEFFNWSENRKTCDPTVLKNIQAIANRLEGVRAYLGGLPIKIHSGYRPPAINRAVGGVSNSQHITGGAVDISVPGLNIFDVQRKLDGYWDGALGYGAKRGFVHLDLRPNRIRWNY